MDLSNLMCFNTLQLLSLLMITLFHFWPVDCSSDWFLRPSNTSLGLITSLLCVMTRCSKFILNIFSPDLELPISPRIPGSIRGKCYFKSTIWEYIRMFIVIISSFPVNGARKLYTWMDRW